MQYFGDREESIAIGWNTETRRKEQITLRSLATENK